MDRFDVVVIGGGVIGCAVTRELLSGNGHLQVCLLEGEPSLAAHQSGRNSGVVHAGYNQKPGTKKARLVVEGSKRLREYCQTRSVGLRQDGILVVANDTTQLEIVKELYRRGKENGANVRLIDQQQLNKLEPHAKGFGALFAPDGASFDARGYVLALADDAREMGASVFLSESAQRLQEKQEYIELESNKRVLRTRILVNCAGLYADQIAHQMGIGREFQIIPFKGSYWELTAHARHLVRSHIYPAPNLQFPFLGIHLSRAWDDRILVGPGASIALGRVAYGQYDCNPKDITKMLSFPGFWKLFLSKEFCRLSINECKKALFSRAVLHEARQLLPILSQGDITQSQAGIRAQLVTDKGEMVDDLVIKETSRSIHILNAVSPALTCSLPFADHIVSLIAKKLCLSSPYPQVFQVKS